MHVLCAYTFLFCVDYSFVCGKAEQESRENKSSQVQCCFDQMPNGISDLIFFKINLGMSTAIEVEISLKSHHYKHIYQHLIFIVFLMKLCYFRLPLADRFSQSVFSLLRGATGVN